MYEKAEEDAIETQLQERATQFAQELVKVSTVQSGLVRSDPVRSPYYRLFRKLDQVRIISGIPGKKANEERMGHHQYAEI